MNSAAQEILGVFHAKNAKTRKGARSSENRQATRKAVDRNCSSTKSFAILCELCVKHSRSPEGPR